MQLLQLGETLDSRYSIISHLGGGRFGQTYLAEDLKLTRNYQCIVKQIKPTSTDLSTLQAARDLFDREAEILNFLGGHKRVPSLLDDFEEEKEFYLVQEFIEGHSLNEELQLGKRMSESYVLSMLKNVLQTLAFVHQHKVIHRDIKPSNLVRRESDGKIILNDFGAVKQISTQIINSQGKTEFTVAIGTPGYIPSEQSQGNPRLSSDVYALGIMAIQALTGLTPDRLEADPETAEIIWRDRVIVSAHLANFIDNMVRYDFRQRYPSAIEALQQLDHRSPVISIGLFPAALPPKKENEEDIESKFPPSKVSGINLAPLIPILCVTVISSLLRLYHIQASKEEKKLVLLPVPYYSFSPTPATIPTDKTAASAKQNNDKNSVTPLATSQSGLPDSQTIYQLSPERVVLDYYLNINDKKYQAAWEQLSPKLQKNQKINPGGYSEYLKFWQTIKRVNIKDIKLDNINSFVAMPDATVDISLHYVYIEPNNRSNYYEWRYYLVWNDREGRWLLDNKDSLTRAIE